MSLLRDARGYFDSRESSNVADMAAERAARHRENSEIAASALLARAVGEPLLVEPPTLQTAPVASSQSLDRMRFGPWT